VYSTFSADVYNIPKHAGSEAFSEIENRNVRDFIWERRDTIKFFNTLHSFSQLVNLHLTETRENSVFYSRCFSGIALLKLEALLP
jgi:hypothetical protein